MIKSTMNKGFQMVFENGVMISVQFGFGNYCANRNLEKSDFNDINPHIFESTNAEILIEDREGNAITSKFAETVGIRNDGTVAGWVTPELIAEAIIWAKNFQPVNEEYNEYLRLKEKYEGTAIQ